MKRYAVLVVACLAGLLPASMVELHPPDTKAIMRAVVQLYDSTNGHSDFQSIRWSPDGSFWLIHNRSGSSDAVEAFGADGLLEQVYVRPHAYARHLGHDGVSLGPDFVLPVGTNCYAPIWLTADGELILLGGSSITSVNGNFGYSTGCSKLVVIGDEGIIRVSDVSLVGHLSERNTAVDADKRIHAFLHGVYRRPLRIGIDGDPRDLLALRWDYYKPPACYDEVVYCRIDGKTDSLPVETRTRLGQSMRGRVRPDSGRKAAPPYLDFVWTAAHTWLEPGRLLVAMDHRRHRDSYIALYLVDIESLSLLDSVRLKKDSDVYRTIRGRKLGRMKLVPAGNDVWLFAPLWQKRPDGFGTELADELEVYRFSHALEPVHTGTRETVSARSLSSLPPDGLPSVRLTCDYAPVVREGRYYRYTTSLRLDFTVFSRDGYLYTATETDSVAHVRLWDN